MGYPLLQNQTAQPLVFTLYETGSNTPKTAAAGIAVTISKNGGTFNAPVGAISEIGNGKYMVAGNATDSNTLGPLLLHATATDCDPASEEFNVVAYDAQAATNLGLSRIDAAITSRSSHSAADVWAANDRTLSSFGTLINDIWAHATAVAIATKTALIGTGGGLVVVQTPITKQGKRITAKRGDSWIIPFEDLGDLSGVTKLWFAVKKNLSDSDSAALVFVEMADAEAVVDDEAAGDIRILIDEAVTTKLPVSEVGEPFVYGLKKKEGGDTTTLLEGEFVITAEPVKAIS